MAQWAKALASKPDNPSSIPEVNMVRGDNQHPKVVLDPPQMCRATHIHMHKLNKCDQNF